MAPPRFTGEISAGHISIIVTLLGGLLAFYSNVTGTLSAHEYRLGRLEKTVEDSRLRQEQFQTEMRVIAQGIREDVAVMKSTIKHLEDRP